MERWKDKVELSLDGRQIFFLFFGGAIAACLLFVTGVLVGRRIEARALALSPPPVEDPLAALDQLGEAAEVDESLTYHQTLTDGKPARAAETPVSPKPADTQTKSTTPTPPTKALPQKPEPTQLAKVMDPVKVESPRPVAIKNEELPRPPVAVPTETKGEKAELAKKIDPAKDAAKDTAKVDTTVAAATQKTAAVPTPASALKKDGTGGRFTLQLSAFPERVDAEDFMKKMQTAGYKAFMVQSEVPGKGTFYRVRVGEYASRDAALAAKNEFERKQRSIAYVAKF